MSNISIDKLGSEVQKIIEDYQRDVTETVKEVLPKVGKDTVKELKQTSPKKTGKYAKGWKTKVEEGRFGSTVTVYNETRYQLTHLLEKGHATRNGGRVSGRPHIKPAEEHASKNVLDLLKRDLEK